MTYFFPQRTFWHWLLVIQLLGVLYLALMPTQPESLDLGWDKLNHLFAFACLTVTTRLALGPIRVVLGFGLLSYGALIEILQSLTPTRHGEWADLLADGLGIAIGIMLSLVFDRLRARLHKSPS